MNEGTGRQQAAIDPQVEFANDVCALPLVRRLAALLDRDPYSLKEGMSLPRGWHVFMFNVPTIQSRLRPDGATELGITLPDLGLPRLMMGGRRIEFLDDIQIGQRVVRDSRLLGVNDKNGRSGRFAVVEIQHRIAAEGAKDPAIIETTSYIMREASEEPSEGPAQGAQSGVYAPAADAIARRSVVLNEAMLFRYSAVTDNPHRIHYDLPYAQTVEGFPALPVNGTLPTMLLLEIFRETSGREPNQIQSRNLAPLYCGEELHLGMLAQDEAWVLQVHNRFGTLCMQATVL